MDLDLLDYLRDRKFVVPDSELQEVEKRILALERDRKTSLVYNEFRIANAGRHQTKRPQVITGGLFNPNIPNLHTEPLTRFADVVFLSASHEKFTHKCVINCNNSTHFFDVLEQLPRGFSPDFYWDNQVEKDHYIPKGIEMSPFPTVASVCHSYYHLTIENICSLFDLVLPLSKLHCRQLEKKFPGKILEIPFGLNWGCFDFFLDPNFEKTVDVCITFGPREDPANQGRRTIVIEMAKAFQKKYGDRFSFVFAYDRPLDEYITILRNSLITINIAGAHGPYNYRTIEALCSGSMIFEGNWSDGFFKNDFNERFQDGIHGVSFTFDNFEEKLLYYLTHQKEAIQIAKQGYEFLKKNYSYEQLFGQLYTHVKKMSVPPARSFPKGLGYYYADMIYYYQWKPVFKKMINFGLLQVYNEEVPWIRSHNKMVLFDLPKETLGNTYATSLETDLLNTLQSGDRFLVIETLYKEALKTIPDTHRWLLEWNFYLMALQEEKATEKQRQDLLELLLKEVEPFPERAIFKYGTDEEDDSSLYFELNLNLLKVIDQPKERANLFRRYAIDYLNLETCR